MSVQSLRLGPNVKLIKWAPQNDILGHPAVKAFITHAGSNSLYEAAYHGKPIVCISLMANQFDQAAKVQLVASCNVYLLLHTCISALVRT